MKKNFVLLFLYLIGFAFFTKAQNITFEEGPELEKGIGTSKDRTIGEDENSFYILRSLATGTIYQKKRIEKFNKKTLASEYSTDIPLEKKEYMDDIYYFFKNDAVLEVLFSLFIKLQKLC